MKQELIQAIAEAIDNSSIDISHGDVTTDNDDVELSIQHDKKDPTKLVINEWHSQWYSDDPRRRAGDGRFDDSKSIYHSFDELLERTFDHISEWSEDGDGREDFNSLHKQILHAVETHYQKARERFSACARCGNDIECIDNSLCNYCIYVAEKDCAESQNPEEKCKSKIVQRIEDAGYHIEKKGQEWHVWHEDDHSVVAIYDRLRDIRAFPPYV